MKTGKGRVYWITGLSGAGKTTVGVALYYRLKETHDNVIILDGDILKLFTAGDANISYTNEGRLSRAKKYSHICKMLADQGMYVIICTIAMFEEVRQWNRRHINGYIEIFLNVSMVTLHKRNKRNLYLTTENNKQVVGLNSSVEFPKDADIELLTDGSISVAECVDKIIELVPRHSGDFDRDSHYWNEYYAARANLTPRHSDFATLLIADAAARSFERHEIELLEIGCGNGRDSLFFLESGINVTGIDAASFAIEELQRKTKHLSGAIFICDDFVKCKVVYQRQYDYIYSRFTLHAINESQENELWDNIASALKLGGKLFVEARTVHDDIYGQGIPAEKNAFIFNGHYRRFVDKKEVIEKLTEQGLHIEYAEESRGFSRTNSSDPVLMRLIAVKKQP